MLFLVAVQAESHDTVSAVAARLLVESGSHPDEASALEAAKPMMAPFYASIMGLALRQEPTETWAALKQDDAAYAAKLDELLIPEVRRYVIDGHDRVVDAVAKRLVDEGIHSDPETARDAVRDHFTDDHYLIIEMARIFMHHYPNSKVNIYEAIKDGSYNEKLDGFIGGEGYRYVMPPRLKSRGFHVWLNMASRTRDGRC